MDNNNIIQTSEKFKIDKTDIIRSVILSLASALAAIILQFLDAWISNPLKTTFDKISFILSLKVAVATWVAAIIRKYLKPSETIIKPTSSNK